MVEQVESTVTWRRQSYRESNLQGNTLPKHHAMCIFQQGQNRVHELGKGSVWIGCLRLW